MEKILPYAGFAVAALAFIYTHFRSKEQADLGERCGKLETKVDLIVQFFLKDAVLSFHSPDPKHKQADQVIERLVEGEELKPEEIDILVDRIKDEAHHADHKSRRLQATMTLALLDEFIGVVGIKAPSRISELE